MLEIQFVLQEFPARAAIVFRLNTAGPVSKRPVNPNTNRRTLQPCSHPFQPSSFEGCRFAPEPCPARFRPSVLV